MVVMDWLTNVSMYGFNSRAAFTELSVSFVYSVVPILIIIRRNINIVKNHQFLKGGTIIALCLLIN